MGCKTTPLKEEGGGKKGDKSPDRAPKRTQITGGKPKKAVKNYGGHPQGKRKERRAGEKEKGADGGEKKKRKKEAKEKVLTTHEGKGRTGAQGSVTLRHQCGKGPCERSQMEKRARQRKKTKTTEIQ